MASRPSDETLTLADLPPCKGGMSRRGFCVSAGAGLVTLGLAACDPGARRVEVGGLSASDGNSSSHGGPHDGGVGGGNPDLAQGGGSNPDLAQGGGNPDLATGAGCAGPVNAGSASAMAMGQAKHFSDNVNYDLYVVRDSGGLYAMNAACPHAGCTVKEQSSKWYCPCHGATFDLNGQNPTSPAFAPLDHYALCVDASGNILVDYNTVVPYTTRA